MSENVRGRKLVEQTLIACQRAIDFLLEHQALEGSWADYLPGFSSTGWVSGYVGRFLLMARDSGLATAKLEKPMKRTFGWLLSIQTHDGGWSWSPRVVTDADSTANCLLCLMNMDKTPLEVLQRGVKALLCHQNPETGGIHTYTESNIVTAVFRHTPFFAPLPPMFYYGWRSTCSSITGISGTVLWHAGYDRTSPAVQGIINYLRREQSPDGFWPAYWWRDPLFSTFHCVQALHLWGEGDLSARAVAWVERTQQADGGWNDGILLRSTPFSTALGVSTLLEGTEVMLNPAAVRGIKWLVEAQLQDGSWEAVPNQQVPALFEVQPWKRPADQRLAGVFPDFNRFFTTATVLGALVSFGRAAGFLPAPAQHRLREEISSL